MSTSADVATSSSASAASAVAVQVLATTGNRGEWSSVTLELLGDAAALAKRLNGTVSVWVPTTPSADVSNVAELARHGVQHATLLRHDRFADWSSESIATALAANVHPGCRLLMLPGTARGEESAALLAARLDTVWIPDVLTLSVTRTGTIEIAAVQPGGKLSRGFRAEADRPVVITMRPGVAEAKPTATATDLIVQDVSVDLTACPQKTFVDRFLPADPRTVDLAVAYRIVSGGRGTGGPDGMQLVETLAHDLQASLGASRMVVDLGWASPERQVGQTGKTVRPDLYVACGISGASHHLAGMRDSRHIVAINSERTAAIHEVAHLSLHGDLHQLIPTIREALKKRTIEKK